MHNIGTPRCPCVSSSCPPLPPAAPAMPAVLQEEPLRAHAVVCTLPLGALQRGSVAFDPPLPGVHCVLCAVLCAALYMLHAVRCGPSGSLWTAKCVGSAGCPALQSTSRRPSLGWPWAPRTGWPCCSTRQDATQCGAPSSLSFYATPAVAGGHALRPGMPPLCCSYQISLLCCCCRWPGWVALCRQSSRLFVFPAFCFALTGEILSAQVEGVLAGGAALPAPHHRTLHICKHACAGSAQCAQRLGAARGKLRPAFQGPLCARIAPQ